MLPRDLTAEGFKSYPPEARALAGKNIALLRQLPPAFLPLLLRELIDYDWKFPAERAELDNQFAYLNAQKPQDVEQMMSPFAKLTIPDELQNVDWVNVPAEFSERLSAYLWSSHQIDTFRTASVDYVHRLNAAKPSPAPPLPRLGIVLAGKEVTNSRAPLFRRLRPHGVQYTNVNPEQGFTVICDFVRSRAAAHPIPFGHWYIEGGNLAAPFGGVTSVSYKALRPVCSALLAKMAAVMAPGGGGPELLRSELQRMQPQDVGFAIGENAVLSRFQLSLLTEGSGTQIFSTTFVQWAAREAWRRAQPYTLLARYAPRRRQAAIGKEDQAAFEDVDPEGSLVDADMGAYYTWVNQQRLPDAAQARFLVWYEGHNQAVAIAPGLRPGTQEPRAITVQEILTQLA